MNAYGGFHHGVVPQYGHGYPIRGHQVVYAQPAPVAGPSYSSTVPPMQGLPQPPPVVAYDVNEFRNFFRFGLNQLHANSKYIINDLTTLAGTFQHRMATVVSKELEQFLRIAHPTTKLNIFYTLDSICKNVGHPYTQIFRPWIEMAILTAYKEVEELDPNVTVKYHELLGTWRTSGPQGTALFGGDIQRRIENGIFGHWRTDGEAGRTQAFESGMKQQPAAASPMEKSALMYDLRRILQTRDEIASRYPGDDHNRTQLAALRQLEQLVATQQLTLLQVDDIRQQLQTMKLPTPPPEAPVFDVMNPANIAALGQLIHDNPTVLQDAVQGHQQQRQNEDAPTGSNVFGAIHEALSGALANPESAQATADAVAAQPALLQSLIEQQLFSADQLKGALAFLKFDPIPPATAAPEVVEDPFVADYESLLESFDVVLKPGSTLKPRPDLCEILYGKIPRSVRQDGARFLEGPTGDKRQAAHLDHLFRLNRSVRAGAAGREQGRMWATLEADWIVSKDFLPDDESPDREGGRDVGKEEDGPEKIDPDKATLPRPTDPTLAAAVCPVCKDVFETRFDDDDGDFFWTNAVEVEGKPWHALCRAEFLASSAKAAKSSSAAVAAAAAAAKGEGSRAASRDVTPGLANGGQVGRGTPSLREKVLGKRKSATPEVEDTIKRVKAEPA